MSSSLVITVLASGVLLCFSGGVQAKDVFNSALLEIDHPMDVDIRQFNRANNLPAGIYKVDISVNGKLMDRRDVTFVQDSPQSELHPCFVAVKDALKELGVKADALKSMDLIDDKACINPEPLVPGATWKFDPDE